MSTQSETRPVAVEQAPTLRRQHEQILATSADDTGRVAVTWQRLAELLDDLVTDYDEHLESGAGLSRQSGRAAAEMLGDLLDGFDVAAAAARRNAEVLDDLATEITLAQARITTIWNDMQSDRLRKPQPPPTALERSYSARAAREAWYPLSGDLAAARDRLQVVRSTD